MAKKQSTDLVPGSLVQQLDGKGEQILAQNLAPGERILVKLQGEYGQALVVTDQRAYIAKWGFMTGQTFGGKCIGYEFRNITAVEIRKSLAAHMVVIQTGANQDNNRLSFMGDRNKGNNANESDNAVPYLKAALHPLFQDAVNLIREQISAAHSPQTTSGPEPVASVMDQLSQLGQLRDAGVLTEDEFNAKKAELLSRL